MYFVPQVVFLIDYQAMIHNLGTNSPTECQLTPACREQPTSLASHGWVAYLQWISSSVRIPGNEQSDILTKVGTAQPQPELNMMLTSMRNNIDTVVNKRLQAYYRQVSRGKSWECLTKPSDLPRKVTVASFRLSTGHDQLQAHLHKTDDNTHQCPLCNNGRMYPRHFTSVQPPCMPDSVKNLGSAASILSTGQHST